jgi:tRNA1(Val) A37 N6-methylase TrmN6
MERNPEIPFTYEYSQPEEYHFSIDSIEMPWEVVTSLKARLAEGELAAADLKEWKVLDLCAGCGVLGFELNFHLPDLCHIDFVEVQEIYQNHFEHNKNLALAKVARPKRMGLRLIKEEETISANTAANTSPAAGGAASEFQFRLMNYENLLNEEDRGKYQLILCNPPYFQPGQGKLSPSEFKNRCRFFLDSTFEKLIAAIEWSLADRGEAYFLLRDLQDHDIDLLTELRRLTKGRLKIENLALIRGTFLLKMYR